MDSLERRREYQRKYREANREKINLYLKEWHKKNRSTQIEYFKYKYNMYLPRYNYTDKNGAEVQVDV